MAGCSDVCIDMDYDESNEFYTAIMRKARRPHQCRECHQTIQPGEKYEYVSGKSGGDVWMAKTCAICLAIRDALVCGTWVHGQLWEEIEEGIFPAWQRLSPLDCLAKIDSLAARDALRARYRMWQGES